MSDNEVQIGDIVFVVDPNSQATPEDRQNMIELLEQYSRMPEFTTMFSGSGMDHNLPDNKVNVYVGDVTSAGGYGDLGGTLDSDGLYKVGSASIFIDPEVIDESRYFSPEDNEWHEESVASVMANELGNLAATLNKNLDIPNGPGTATGNDNTIFGYPYGADSNGDPLPAPPPNQATPTPGSWADQTGPLENYSAQVEDVIHDLFGEPKRVSEGPGSYDLNGGATGNDPSNVSIWKSAQEWFDIGMSSRSQAERDFMDDVLSLTGYDWQNDALNDALLDYAWGEYDFAWDAAAALAAGLIIAAAFGPASPWALAAYGVFLAAWNNGSPLVLDLDGDGVELVSLANSNIYWDIDQDGFAEATGWVQADDGFLAIDANLDGIITDHSELFGSVAEDGFADLSLLDSNSDSVINASDAAFADLLVWRDLNQNGFSEANELFSLADLDIVSINLNATAVNQTNEGHDISHVSTYTVDDGVSGPLNLSIVDVWFLYDDINSKFIGDYTLDLASLFTVNQRGYGTLPDLFVVASEDNDLNDPDSLLSLLTAFSAKTLDELLADDSSVLAEVQAIMYRWAGVDGVDPASRGPHVNAQQLEFLEELFGQEFLQQGFLEDPGGLAGDLLDKAFDIALDAIAARLIAQGAGQALFAGSPFYNPVADSLDGVTGLNQDTLDSVLAMAQDASQVSDKVAFWKGVVNVIDQLVGVDNLSSGDQTALNAAISTSDSTLSTALILESLEWLSEVGSGYVGTSGNDTLSGTVGDDTFAGGAGADTITGGIGADFINGQSGDDILNGQSGDDELLGDSGNDTYLYFAGQGHDIIRENGSGSDRILFGPGITFSDLTLTRITDDDLLIEVSEEAGGGAITIKLQFRSSDAGYVETLEFSDSSTVSLNSLVYTMNGTSGADNLHGIRYGGSPVDAIYGHEGDDVIYGYHSVVDSADNFLSGGDGNDQVYGASGVDTIEGNAGNDTLRGNNGNDILDGGDGDDTLYGGAHDDLLMGGDGADFLYGEGQNDTLAGGLGADELTGGAGNDIFLFLEGQSFDAVDTIKDFSTTYDKIDISNIIDFDPMTHLITDFVQITDSGSNSLLAVDADGGGDNFVQIAVILNKTGLTDEAALLAGGQLLAA